MHWSRPNSYETNILLLKPAFLSGEGLSCPKRTKNRKNSNVLLIDGYTISIKTGIKSEIYLNK
jgi:hypothetical protein